MTLWYHILLSHEKNICILSLFCITKYQYILSKGKWSYFLFNCSISFYLMRSRGESISVYFHGPSYNKTLVLKHCTDLHLLTCRMRIRSTLPFKCFERLDNILCMTPQKVHLNGRNTEKYHYTNEHM